MSDISIRKAGKAGRITLARPEALNALTYDMVRQIHEVLDLWGSDPTVALVVVDAEGERAFCSGGDIAEMYATATRGDFGYGRRFWADEYRLNAAIVEYPKPIVTFLQGFTMGGGVGVGCLGSHRIVGESSKIAMPECGIGLVPDVGGSMILAKAPGHLGEYLGMTGARMGPGDAIYAGFADSYIPEASWADAISKLEETGDAAVLTGFMESPPKSDLKAHRPEIDKVFGWETPRDIIENLDELESALAERATKALTSNSPLSMACALEIIRRVRLNPEIRSALEQEYRFTWRSAEDADFIEGIRAQIIDKDRNPHWKHEGLTDVSQAEVDAMLAPISGKLW